LKILTLLNNNVTPFIKLQIRPFHRQIKIWFMK
jgi:hypothetical protein